MPKATQLSTPIFLGSKAHTLSSIACFPKRVLWNIHDVLCVCGGGQLLVDKHLGKH